MHKDKDYLGGLYKGAVNIVSYSRSYYSSMFFKQL